MDWPDIQKDDAKGEISRFMGLLHEKYHGIMSNKTRVLESCHKKRVVDVGATTNFVLDEAKPPTHTPLFLHAFLAVHLSQMLEALTALRERLQRMKLGHTPSLIMSEQTISLLFVNMLHESLHRKVRNHYAKGKRGGAVVNLCKIQKNYHKIYNKNVLLQCIHTCCCVKERYPTFDIHCLMIICSYLVKIS